MRNLKNLDDMISMSHEFLDKTGAVYNKVEKLWTFSEGGRLKFSYLDNESDKFQYKGQQYNYIGIDELTRFPNAEMFDYLFSRIRRKVGVAIPGRMRCATNPGDIGAEWVYNRFINPETRDARSLYLPMSYTENKYLDQADYEDSLSMMTGVERIRMQYGDWLISDAVSMINRKWIKNVTNVPESDRKQKVRVWDIASTVKNAANKDPDWTVGALCSHVNGIFTIENVVRLRGTPFDVEKKIIETYHQDAEHYGYEIDTYIEMGNNSGSKTAIDLLLRGPFSGMSIKAITSNVPKEERARPFAVAAENGYVQMMDGSWNKDFLTELDTFPSDRRGLHDDIVDAVVYCYINLVVARRRVKASVTKYGQDRWSDSQMMTVLRSR